MFIPYQIILGSKSPRRKELLQQLNIAFKVLTKDVAEDYPIHLKREEVALYVCQQKANAFGTAMAENTVVITADTIVCIEEMILNKPHDEQEAVEMLQFLSGKKHDVITAVCLKSNSKSVSFFETTAVYFKPLSMEEIKQYITDYAPYDKAGSYGVQENFSGTTQNTGYCNRFIEKIEGSYSNVMGFPLEKFQDVWKLYFSVT